MTEVDSSGPRRAPLFAGRSRTKKRALKGSISPAEHYMAGVAEGPQGETSEGLVRRFEEALIGYRQMLGRSHQSKSPLPIRPQISLAGARPDGHPPEAVALVALEQGGALRFLAVSPARTTKAGAAELTGLTLSEILTAYPDGATMIEQKYRECVETNTPTRFSWRTSASLGDTIRETNLLPIPDADGKVALIVAHWRERPPSRASVKEWEAGEIQRLQNRLEA